MDTRTGWLGAALLALACGGRATTNGNADGGHGGGGRFDASRRADASGNGPLASPCASDRDCKAPLLCRVGACHAPCASSLDCPSGQRCVQTAPLPAICQVDGETRCQLDSDCPTPLVCAPDGQCRNQCAADRDCVAGQTCATGGVCRDPAP